jgi:hypothetical protein
MPELGVAEQAASADGLLVRREGRLGFRHDLLREAVYADLPNPRRYTTGSPPRWIRATGPRSHIT